MARPKLTIEQAKTMPFTDLVETAHGLIEAYEAPQHESHEERLARIDRTLDELPDVYGWLLQLQSWFDHWTDYYAELHSTRHHEYKRMRERRDAMERAAKAAKSRWEGTSRVLTGIMDRQDESRMPRGRG